MQSLSTSYDAVVIGSGHNGLVAAAYLAKAGRSVLVLEKSADFGGATTSKRVFPDHDALLSRYAYLVSLFPRTITDDLGLDFQTRRRRIASFTPWTDSAGRQRGLLLSNEDEGRSRDSMREMTGSDAAWNRYQQLLALESAFAGASFILSPTCAGHAPAQGAVGGLVNGKPSPAWIAYTAAINMTRNPAGTVCVGYTRSGLPIGLQVIGRQRDDRGVLKTLCYFEDLVGARHNAPAGIVGTRGD